MIIEKEMIVGFIHEKHPSSVRVLKQYGIDALDEKTAEKILSSIDLSGIIDIDDLVDELNMAATKEQGRSGMVTGGL